MKKTILSVLVLLYVSAVFCQDTITVRVCIFKQPRFEEFKREVLALIDSEHRANALFYKKVATFSELNTLAFQMRDTLTNLSDSIGEFSDSIDYTEKFLAFMENLGEQEYKLLGRLKAVDQKIATASLEIENLTKSSNTIHETSAKKNSEFYNWLVPSKRQPQKGLTGHLVVRVVQYDKPISHFTFELP